MLEAFQTYWHADQGEPRFLLQLHDPEAATRHRWAAVTAVLYQFSLVALALILPAGGGSYSDAPRVVVDYRRVTPLVAPTNLPPFKLTQKEVQQAKPAAEVDLAALLPRPEVRQPQQTPQGKPFVPPPGLAQSEQTRAPEIEAPKIDPVQQGIANLPAAPLSRFPPSPEPPKAANPFERVGGPQPQPGAAPSALPRLVPPKSGVEEAVRSVSRGGGGRGLIVGDTGGGGGGGLSEAISQDPSPKRSASTLELISDPQGIDFRPYLIQVLAAVKRNWQSVTPESARLGLQGRTVVQFSISKSGSVPKLVIAMPSGRDTLDRAAVAGISASNPFPPLPNEFRGSEIRLQLVFSYNMPR